MLRPLFVLLWTTGYLAGSLGTAAAPPLALTFWRFLLAGLLLAGLAAVSRAPWPRGRRAWRDAIVTGLLLQGLQFTGVYLGLAHGTSAALCSLLISLCPLLVAAGARPLLGERFTGWQWAGSAVAVAGIVVAASDRIGGTGGFAGLAWTGLGLLGFAGGTLYQKRVGATMDLRTGTAVQLFAAALGTAPVALLAGQGLALPHTVVGAGALAWLAVVNSIGGMTVLFVLLRRGGGADTASLLYLVPPVTALLAWPVLGQPVTAAVVAGLVLSGAGVLLVRVAGRRAAARDRAPAPGRAVERAPLGRARGLRTWRRGRTAGAARRRSAAGSGPAAARPAAPGCGR